MKKGISFLLLLLLAMSVVSLGIIGCGGDEEEKKETTTKPTSATEPADDEVANKPIDFAAEKAALQKVWSDFVNGFNTFDMKNVEHLWAQKTTDQFHFIIGEKEQSGWEGWAGISVGMKGLWEGIGTKGTRWSGSTLNTFYIRRNEASAKGPNAYQSGPGITYVYFVKVKDAWLISQVDTVANNNLAFRNKPLIPRYFEDEKDKAP
ncbi:hypothetical protein HYR99_23200 [Candidatus Poribacteria bacterium]|nr:hypothetical protein [Candidatus Poribacteria bacterium]